MIQGYNSLLFGNVALKLNAKMNFAAYVE